MVDTSVCAIVITYNPDNESFIKCLSTYSDQVKEVVIVDNGSDMKFKKLLEQLNLKGNISIIYNNENIGIASALNIGVNYAINEGYEWIITFDHDSEVATDMISKMFEVYETELKNKKVGIIAPNFIDANTGEKSLYVQKNRIGFKRVASNGKFIEALFVITSGSLFHKSIFQENGLFNEELFIDYVDNEFCLRIISKGYKIYVITEAMMYHRIGERTIYNFGPLKFAPTNHSPIRKYYIVRNRIFTYKKYALKHINWFSYDFLAFINDILRVVVFEEEKSSKIKLMLKGFYHGVTNKYGKLVQ